MEDKQFDELMKKYVASTANSAENDLKRVPEFSTKKNGRRLLGRSVLALSACVLFSLAIILPFALAPSHKVDLDSEKASFSQEEEEFVPTYCMDNEFFPYILNSYDELAEYGFSDYLMPTLQDVKPGIVLSARLGGGYDDALVHIDFDLYTYDYDAIKIGFHSKKYRMSNYAVFEQCKTKSTWRDYKIKSSCYYIEVDELYNTRITMSDDKYYYCIEIECYNKMSPNEFLDYIYG